MKRFHPALLSIPAALLLVGLAGVQVARVGDADLELRERAGALAEQLESAVEERTAPREDHPALVALERLREISGRLRLDPDYAVDRLGVGEVGDTQWARRAWYVEALQSLLAHVRDLRLPARPEALPVADAEAVGRHGDLVALEDAFAMLSSSARHHAAAGRDGAAAADVFRALELSRLVWNGDPTLVGFVIGVAFRDRALDLLRELTLPAEADPRPYLDFTEPLLVAQELEDRADLAWRLDALALARAAQARHRPARGWGRLGPDAMAERAQWIALLSERQACARLDCGELLARLRSRTGPGADPALPSMHALARALDETRADGAVTAAGLGALVARRGEGRWPSPATGRVRSTLLPGGALRLEAAAAPGLDPDIRSRTSWTLD